MHISGLTLLGLSAATLTTVSFLPQLIKVVKTRQTKDISIAMYVLFSVGLILWTIYGCFKHDIAIISANLITLSFVFTILFYKKKYG